MTEERATTGAGPRPENPAQPENPSKPENLPTTNEDKKTIVDAWIQSSLEFDKSLLAVASAGLGLIAALADKFQKGPTFLPLVLTGSASAFALVILAVLTMFRINKIYLEAEKGSRWGRFASISLSILDIVTPIIFLVAIGGTLFATGGLLLHKENTVTNKDEAALEILKKIERGELSPTLESLNRLKDVMQPAQAHVSLQPPVKPTPVQQPAKPSQPAAGDATNKGAAPAHGSSGSTDAKK